MELEDTMKKTVIEIELPPDFEKGECRMCPIWQQIKIGFHFKEGYCPLNGNKDNCPLEIIYEEDDRKDKECEGCKYISWPDNYFPCRDCVDNSNYNCISNFERFGSCKECPVDNSDPFQTPGACHRCLDIRGL